MYESPLPWTNKSKLSTHFVLICIRVWAERNENIVRDIDSARGKLSGSRRLNASAKCRNVVFSEELAIRN